MTLTYFSKLCWCHSETILLYLQLPECGCCNLLTLCRLHPLPWTRLKLCCFISTLIDSHLFCKVKLGYLLFKRTFLEPLDQGLVNCMACVYNAHELRMFSACVKCWSPFAAHTALDKLWDAGPYPRRSPSGINLLGTKSVCQIYNGLGFMFLSFDTWAKLFMRIQMSSKYLICF